MSRRCLICCNINPCRLHSAADQRAELARNDAEIAEIRARQAMPTNPPVASLRAIDTATTQLLDEIEGRVRGLKDIPLRIGVNDIRYRAIDDVLAAIQEVRHGRS